ncbi:MAG: aminoacyl-histidine dipeptidase [Candidatus Riflebacteria bacterium]|nr:aminoacyl-histidine dipeptidase [Candidatus Riflebacteria bacterium]
MKKSKILSQILSIFEEISSVPRESGKEEKIRSWLVKRAQDNGFDHISDEVGNILIKVPASKGNEKSETLVLQCHMDMVCEKIPESKHDFLNDPIKLIYDEEWMKADGTSLGADNGIGIALALAIAEDPVSAHPPLELFFTVDEERGLTGAKALKRGFFQGKKLINLDSEDEGVFTIGCAGGIDTHIELPLYYEDAPQNTTPFKISSGGMTGGHSGVNINGERANAIKLLARTLFKLKEIMSFRIVNFKGGTAHNAIPRNAETVIYIPHSLIPQFNDYIKMMNDLLRSEYSRTDPNLFISCQPCTCLTDRRAMNDFNTHKAIDLLLGLPHGVAARSTEMPELVETSNNLATIKVEDGSLKITCSQRSSVPSKLEEITWKIEAVARLSGAKASSGTGYPPWKPNFDSPFLKQAKASFKKQFRKEPVIEVIHAGLECGLIGAIVPDMEMVSLGPTIQNPHSPDERLNVPSVEKVWKFLTTFFKEF